MNQPNIPNTPNVSPNRPNVPPTHPVTPGGPVYNPAYGQTVQPGQILYESTGSPLIMGNVIAMSASVVVCFILMILSLLIRDLNGLFPYLLILMIIAVLLSLADILTLSKSFLEITPQKIAGTVIDRKLFFYTSSQISIPAQDLAAVQIAKSKMLLVKTKSGLRYYFTVNQPEQAEQIIRSLIR